MHRHRALCERAVDPLEIAAGLEAHGVTDRTAARFKHRDVFSLAEELYARVPRAEGEPAPRPGPGPERHSPARAVLWLLPGAVCAVTLTLLWAPPFADAGAFPPRVVIGLAGAVLALAALRLCLRGLARTGGTTLWGCWLVGYALFGDWLLAEFLSGGPEPVPVTAPAWVPLALAFGLVPAAWCARWFALRARLRLASSRSLGEFAARTRPLLAAAVGLCALGLTAVQLVARLVTGERWTGAGGVAVAALGMLLFAALLLAAHGFPQAVAAGLGAACAVQAVALGSVLAARLPGLGPLAYPVEYVLTGYGTAAIPAVACAAAALALLGYAATALTGASAHHRTPQ